MNSKLSTKFALKNLKANKIVNIPYILSTSIMVAILFIMISLLDNKYVMQKDQFGAIIVFLIDYYCDIYICDYYVC